MEKFFKGTISFIVVYVLSFAIIKAKTLESYSSGVTTDGSEKFAAAFMAFFFSFIPAFMSGLVVGTSNPQPTTWSKEKFKRFGKILLVSILLIISFYFYPVISSFIVYALFSAYYFFMAFLLFAFVIASIYYLFGDMPIVRRVVSFLFLGGMFDLIDGIDSFSGDIYHGSGADVGSVDGQLGGAVDSGGIGAEESSQIGNEGTPVDPDLDSEIEGFDLSGDGNVDINVIGVEVPETEYVDGYVRKDGTLVSPYIRSVADSVAVNNLDPSA